MLNRGVEQLPVECSRRSRFVSDSKYGVQRKAVIREAGIAHLKRDLHASVNQRGLTILWRM